MNQLKRYTIAGAVFVIILGIVSHFVYNWSNQNFIIGFFFASNESTWEHMKLAFFPMLLTSVYLNYRLKPDYPCITSSLSLGILLSTLLIPILFYTYTGILGYNIMLLDIATFPASIIIAFICIYKITQSCSVQKYETLLKALVLIMAIMFFVFTYFPPDIGIFADPTVVNTATYIF